MKTLEVRKLERRLEQFLEDLVAPMGRSERRHWACVYVEGLLMDGERKSMEPLATRTGADVQALRQFVGQSPWDTALVQEQLAIKLGELFPSLEAWLIDETSFVKAGSESVGVARQYCGALGKTANCQVAVSLHFCAPQVSCPVSWRLYLPREWAEDPQRRERVKIPKEVVYRSKNELALELIDQIQQWKVPKAPVVADSAYGNDFAFREALRQHDLSYVLAVEPTTKAWTSDPNLVELPPAKPTGRPRQYAAPESLPKTKTLLEIARELPASAWKTVTWREGTKGPMRSRFALVAVWASHGANRSQRHFERVREWLLVEWQKEDEAPTKYWLGYFGEGEKPTLRQMVKLAHIRWRVELDYREMKDELGLDHFEGRHWLGFHHHVTLVSIAYAFLRSEQLRSKKSRHADLAHDPPQTSGSDHPNDRPLSMVPHKVPQLLVTT